VAGKKTTRTTKKNGKDSQISGSRTMVLFWLVFIIIITSVFLIKRADIKENIDNVFLPGITKSSNREEKPSSNTREEDPIVIVEQPQSRPPARPAPPPVAATTQPSAPQPIPDKPAEKPVPDRPAQQQTEPARPAAPPPVQTRDRSIYFAQINKDGQILNSKVSRKIPVSETPMVDTLNVLLTGPSADEINRGLLNLVPQNTKILSATVRGSTAYISFSEDFLFNTFGMDGYVAQLRQIVWTVTEFQNVKEVQFLIEGRRMDYLVEGVWIGSPISRQSF
jgi:spore germination protein GerM